MAISRARSYTTNSSYGGGQQRVTVETYQAAPEVSTSQTGQGIGNVVDMRNSGQTEGRCAMKENGLHVETHYLNESDHADGLNLAAIELLVETFGDRHACWRLAGDVKILRHFSAQAGTIPL